MVQCSNHLCPSSWFHLACLEPPLRRVPRGDWFCSDECKDSGGYIYCVCKARRGPAEDQNMLRCKLKGLCRRHEKYHQACIRPGPVNPGEYVRQCERYGRIWSQLMANIWYFKVSYVNVSWFSTIKSHLHYQIRVF